MRYIGLYLNNISEVIDFNSHEILSRFPKSLHESLGNNRGFQMTGSEIRLLPKGTVKITIGSLYSYTRAKAVVIYGDQLESYEYDLSTEQEIIITPKTSLPNNSNYNRDLVRIVLIGEMIYIKKVVGDTGNYRITDAPREKLMAYGTSITQGIGATQGEMSYPWILARSLGYECINYGMSGCAFIEPEMIQFLCEKEYDLIILELSINMLGEGITSDEFGVRFTNLVTSLLKKNPNSRLYSIGILPFFTDLKEEKTVKRYREIHAEIIKEINNPRLIHINADELLSPNNLTSDCIHPSNIGMFEIANNLNGIINKNE